MNLLPGIIGSWPTSYFVFEFITWALLIGLPVLVVWKWKKWNKCFLLLLVIGWLTVGYGSYIEPRKLVVREFDISIESLPELRVGLIADIHVGPYKGQEWMEKVVKEINTLELDVLLIPGDFMFGGAEKYATELSPLQNLSVEKKFATLGNHDHDIAEPRNTIQSSKVSEALRNLGIVELKNSRFFWEEQGIWIAGVDDNDLGYSDINGAIGGIEKEPLILLAHSPDIVDELETLPSLIVSGHTHCGQIRFPGMGAVPFTIPTDNGKELERYFYEDKNLFITCGLGEVGPRARLLNPPEIVVLNVN